MQDQSQPAPDFTLPAHDGSEINLSALRPAPVVLFFYPRDDTAGCTREASAFSEQLPAFHAAGAKVFGISKDSLASHTKFAEKHTLTVPLLSDEKSDVCERFEVWKLKKMYGREFMGIERTTFLINGNGEIARVWPKVKVAGHIDEVLLAVQNEAQND